MALKIGRIEPKGTDSRGEWISVENTSPSEPAVLTGHELGITDETKTQTRPHILRFPAAASGAPLVLRPGERAFVFTGPGTSQWHTRPDGQRELWIFLGRGDHVWNNAGDVAYLRRGDGTFIDTKVVGHPARHPGR